MSQMQILICGTTAARVQTWKQVKEFLLHMGWIKAYVIADSGEHYNVVLRDGKLIKAKV